MSRSTLTLLALIGCGEPDPALAPDGAHGRVSTNPTQSLIVDSLSAVIGVGDLDGDGFDDIAAVRGAASTVDVDFGSSGNVIVGYTIAGTIANVPVAGVDVDLDGDTELVLGTATGIEWYAGDRTYAPPDGTIAVPVHASFAPGDFDDDGRVDLLVGTDGTAGTVYFLPGTGSGFGSSTWSAPGGRVTSIGDIDDDGVGDVAVGIPASDQVLLWFGGGTASSPFVGSVTLDDGGSGSITQFGRSVSFLGDATGDGITDFGVGTFDGGTHVFAGRTDRSFAYAPARVFNDGSDGIVAPLGDANGDGWADLSGRYAVEAQTDVFYGTDGAAPAPQTFILSGYRNTLAGTIDANGDGFGDLVGDYAGSVHVQRGAAALPSGTASDTATDGALSSIASVAVGDTDGDGFDDVLVGSPGAGAGGLAALFRGGPSGLDASPILTVSGTAGDELGTSVAIGDVDQDGVTELLIGAPGRSSGAGVIRIVHATDGSTYQDLTDTGSARLGAIVVACDLDADGYVDIATGMPAVSSNRGRVSVFEAGPSGIAVAPAIRYNGGSTGDLFGTSLACGDANGDRKNDLFIGAPGVSSGRGVVYGSPGVAPLTSSAIAWTWTGNFGEALGASLVALDHDGDGDADVAAPLGNGLLRIGSVNANVLGSTIAVTLDPGAALSVAAGDVDGDGDGDLWAGDGAAVNQMSLWTGKPTGLDDAAVVTADGPGVPVAGVGDVDGDALADLVVAHDATLFLHPAAVSDAGSHRAGGQVVFSQAGRSLGTGARFEPGSIVATAYAQRIYGRGRARIRVKAVVVSGPTYTVTGPWTPLDAPTDLSATLPGLTAGQDVLLTASVEYETVRGGPTVCTVARAAAPLAMPRGVGIHVLTALDSDGDGTPDATDCAPTNASIHPGATELPGDEVDQNCDGLETCFADLDDDGYRPDAMSTQGSADADCGDPTEAVSLDPTTDCDDAAATVHPGATEVRDDGIDEDCDSDEICYFDDDDDGYRPNATATFLSTDLDCLDPREARSTDPTTDCNDADPSRNPGAAEVSGDQLDQNCDGAEVCFTDTDDDGYRPNATATTASSDPDCVDAGEAVNTAPTTDCDDTNAAVNPGAVELCDGLDNDCDGTADDVVPYWYPDVDDDGYGVTASGVQSCIAPGGHVPTPGDCDDADPSRYPGASEIDGDEIDGNCDGGERCFLDSDNDGHALLGGYIASADADCDDNMEASDAEPIDDCGEGDPTIHPGATEVCDGVDQDCDGTVDDGVTITVYRDADQDLAGTPDDAIESCGGQSGYVQTGGDCDDADPYVNPNQIEGIGNERDDNCDGIEHCYIDEDGDGNHFGLFNYVESSDIDCDDPGEGGQFTTQSDCDDRDPSRYVGAPEACNLVDDDCDGATDEGALLAFQLDGDGDGYGAPDAGSTVYGCSAPSGSVANGLDCDDGQAAVHPGASEVCDTLDNDCDGYVDDADAGRVGGTSWYPDDDHDGHGGTSGAVTACDAPAFTSAVGDDCDDADGNVFPGAPEQCNGADDDCNTYIDDNVQVIDWFADADGDGVGTSLDVVTSCAFQAGRSVTSGDCDDLDATILPGAPERCDGVDEDCDGTVDEGASDTTLFEPDADGDGYAFAGPPVAACSAPAGYVAQGGAYDCDDGDDRVNPGASEICDSIDDDCNGQADDGLPTQVFYADVDSDTFGDASAPTGPQCAAPAGTVADASDCDDLDPAVNPLGVEVCDQIDQDCDGQVDEGVGTDWFADVDGDGFGDPGALLVNDCVGPANSSADATDCDDGDRTVFPGAPEACNTVDDDCDGTVDEGCGGTDADGDGFVVGPDCDDADASVRPGADELCDGIDQDCDGAIDDDAIDAIVVYQDLDGDLSGDDLTATLACEADPEHGIVDRGGDCDDTDPTNTIGFAWLRDADGDGFGGPSVVYACEFPPPDGLASTPGDCDDTTGGVHPFADEVCDGVDQDCDGAIDEDPIDGLLAWPDADLDGQGDASGTAVIQCQLDPGYANNALDCDDSTRLAQSGGVELCDDDIDNDCDGEADEAPYGWYSDDDGDGFGDSGQFGVTCAEAPTEGVAAVGGDCDDSDDAVFPAAIEICDGVDQDCDDAIDEDAADGVLVFVDADGDGFGQSDTATFACGLSSGFASVGGDCDDADPRRAPGNDDETCDDLDEDCDGLEAEGPPWWLDRDGDAWGDDDTSGTACDRVEFSVLTGGGDCDDRDASNHPFAAEVYYDGEDNDCDPLTDDCNQDGDEADAAINDCGGDDCDDTDPLAYPGAAEDYDDDVDQDCDAFPGWPDEDGDDSPADVDCDDDDDTRYPGADDVFGDDIDQDCDGHDGPDLDGDGSMNDDDCDDTDPTVFPGAIEDSGAADRDCDGWAQSVGPLRLRGCSTSQGGSLMGAVLAALLLVRLRRPTSASP